MDSLQKSKQLSFKVKPEDREHIYAAQLALKEGNLVAAKLLNRLVLKNSPECTLASLNLAACYHEEGNEDEAIYVLDTALLQSPNNHYLHYYRSIIWLGQGNLEEGFREYIHRIGRPGKRKTLHEQWPTIPYWDGEDLKGKRLLVWTEQGIGEEILTASMYPDLIAAGADLIVCGSLRMAPLLERTYPGIKYLPRTDDNNDVVLVTGHDIKADYQASISELGYFLRGDATLFKTKDWHPFLVHDKERTQQLRQTYQAGSQDALIGISWESQNTETGKEKSTSLFDWLSILKLPGYRFVNLQYNPNLNDLRLADTVTGKKLICDRYVNPAENIDSFASQVAAMDLVISVSNTTVHVAGALGIPVWNIVPRTKGRHWYWFKDRTDSPWYPTMKLLRREGSIYHTMGKIEDTLIGHMKAANGTA